MCYHESREKAEEIAYKHWPNTGLKGELKALLPNPTHFEQACSMVTQEDIAQKVVCGPDPEPHLEAIEKYRKAGYDGLSLHQIGPAQSGFFDFYENKVLSRLTAATG